MSRYAFDTDLLKFVGSVTLGWCLLGCASPAEAIDPSTGEFIYRAKCASCHGDNGEGKSDTYPHPLVGERSVGELTDYISKTMPEDKPGTCTGDEARLVAQFIHETFYSPTAQARNKPARIDLSRLTVRQYHNVVADLVCAFRSNTTLDPRNGLIAMYSKSVHLNDADIVVERLDSQVKFDFLDKSPDLEKVEPFEFSIRWEGAVYAPDTGEYDFIVRTDQATQFWLNDRTRPLIDAQTKSDSHTEYRGSIYLLGGRTYPLRLEFVKARVNDPKKEKPPTPASISLEWKRPRRISEVIPSWFLSPARAAEIAVVKTAFPPDDRSLGWEKATTISKEWDRATTEAAIEIAAYIKDHLDELSSSNPDQPGAVEKRKSFCERFAELAFRRPLTDEVKQIYVARSFEQSDDMDTAVKRVILKVLKSPRFLYRELGSESAERNNQYDVAARLSFGLWDSSPDAPLLAAATRGELSSREQVRSQAQRMVADARSQSKLREFLLRWMKIDLVPELRKDAEQFPEFTDAIANDLRTSLELSLDELLTSDSADYRQLLLCDSLYLNGRLARFYGAQLPDDAPFQKISLDPNERVGILSHPYLLADFAYTATSSPIHRGVFIARSILGRTLRTPPEAITPIPPRLQPDLTTRERVLLQTKDESCQSCHAMINSLGFTLEHFDAVGRYRNFENAKPVKAYGSYRTRLGDTVQFDGVRELAKFLAESPETHSAFVEQLFHATIKQPIRAYGSTTKETLCKSFERDNFNIRQLLVEIVTIAALTTDHNVVHTGL